MKLPTTTSREQTPLQIMPPLNHICHSYDRNPNAPHDHHPQLILTQVPTQSASLSFHTHPMFTTIFPISALRILMKMCIILMFSASQGSPFLKPKLAFNYIQQSKPHHPIFLKKAFLFCILLCSILVMA